MKKSKKGEKEDLFKVASSIIEQAYPNIYNKEPGWWGAKRIPNYGILSGAIARALMARRSNTTKKSMKFNEAMRKICKVIAKSQYHAEMQGAMWPHGSIDTAHVIAIIFDKNKKTVEALIEEMAGSEYKRICKEQLALYEKQVAANKKRKK